MEKREAARVAEAEKVAVFLEKVALPEFEIPETGRVAGVDFGTVRVGIAVCDPERIIASPWENYTRRSPRLDTQFFRQLVSEDRVTLFVVGLPLYPSGDESEKSLQAREFGKWLWETTQTPVVFFDERYSSKLADDLMGMAKLTPQKRKERRDKLAAYVILSSWLEAQRRLKRFVV